MNMTNHHKWSLDMVVRAYIGLRLSIWLPIYVPDDVNQVLPANCTALEMSIVADLI